MGGSKVKGWNKVWTASNKKGVPERTPLVCLVVGNKTTSYFFSSFYCQLPSR